MPCSSCVASRRFSVSNSAWLVCFCMWLLTGCRAGEQIRRTCDDPTQCEEERSGCDDECPDGEAGAAAQRRSAGRRSGRDSRGGGTADAVAFRRGGPSGSGQVDAALASGEWRDDATGETEGPISAGIGLISLPSGEIHGFVADHAGILRRVSLPQESAEVAALDDDAFERPLHVDFAVSLEGRVWSTPAILEDMVVVGTDADLLYAIDRERGTIRWQRRVGSCDGVHAPGPEGGRCDVDGGPTVTADGDLLVGADGLYRFAKTGELRWRWPAAPAKGNHVGAAPIELADGSVAFAAQGGDVVRVSSSGELIWHVSVRGDVEGGMVANAALDVFVAGDDGTLRAIDRSGATVWELPLGAPVHAPLALGPHGNIVVVDVRGGVHVVDGEGREQWKYELGTPVYSAPLVGSDGAILICARDDSLHILSSEGRKHEVFLLSDDADGGISMDRHGRLWIGTDAGWVHVLSQKNDSHAR